MNRSTRKLISYSALALGMSVLACGGDDGGTSSPGGGGVGNTGGGGTGGGVGGSFGGGGTGGGFGGGGTGGGVGGGGTGGISGSGGGGTGGLAGTGGGGTGGGTGTDADGDGYDSTKDCDDNNKDVNPGATETCNGIDDNCDTQIDEGVKTTFYVDGDGDNYGVDNASSNKDDCTAPTGFTATKGDCDDTDGAVYPGNTEVCDGKDNDCNGTKDDGVTLTSYYNDVDGDGYGAGTATKACTPPGATWVAQDGDCNDNDKAMFPGNPEICDGKDNDCNAGTPDPGTTTWYQDSDGDGFGSTTVTKTACAQPSGYIAAGGDCNDSDKTINPSAIELCDGKDNNCVNGIDEGPTATWPDADGDGFGDSKGTVSYLCAVPAGRADNNQDCNDKNKAINPDATEIPGNGIDENCDGKDTAAGTQCGYKTYSATTLPDYFTGFFSSADKNTGGFMGTGYYWEDHEISTTAGQTFTAVEYKKYNSAVVPRLRVNGPNSCSAGSATGYALSWGNPIGLYQASVVRTNATAGYYVASASTATANQTGYYGLDILPGNVGGSCGGDGMLVWPHGMRHVNNMDTAPTSSPIPAGYIADDFETYLANGATYTALMGGSAGMVDRIYVSKEGACATGIGTASISGITNGGARKVFTAPSAGVYAFWAAASSSTYSGTAFSFNVVPGNVGESCFTGTAPAGGTGDSYVIWPLGGTVYGSLAIGDRIGDILSTRFHDDYETHLEAGAKINVTVTRTSGSTWTPRVYLTRAGACTTAVASSAQVSGNVGSLTYTVPSTGMGIYTIVVTSSASSATGSYTVVTSY
jgi:hypothetical protein